MVLLSDVMASYGWQIVSWSLFGLLLQVAGYALAYVAGRRAGQREMPTRWREALRKQADRILRERAQRRFAEARADRAEEETAMVRGRAAAFMDIAR